MTSGIRDPEGGGIAGEAARSGRPSAASAGPHARAPGGAADPAATGSWPAGAILPAAPLGRQRRLPDRRRAAPAAPPPACQAEEHLASIIETEYKANGNVPFQRIIITGHCGLGYGMIGPGVLLGDAQKEKPTGRLQVRDYPGSKMKFGGLEDNPKALGALKTALGKALVPNGVLQIASCGYEKEFNEKYEGQQLNWASELQTMATLLGRRVVQCPGKVRPWVRIIKEDGGLKVPEDDIRFFETYGKGWRTIYPDFPKGP